MLCLSTLLPVVLSYFKGGEYREGEKREKEKRLQEMKGEESRRK